ncbi:hypothetical protein GE061_001271 [Apolygus lucorum]|uniref:Uncharacterized protein n=1 Tax=Apolygus lucorum TaxID=248454 RepID=A0A8S9Y6L4_APOLU|nr:hypothetical protein GE061_001271 [Apolygus lucorum]
MEGPSDSQEAITKIRFSAEDDLLLLKEVTAENPFEDGSKWKQIAIKMKRIISKAFTPRNLRERINHLLGRYAQHFQEWQYSSGKDEASIERITLLQEVRDMKAEFQTKKPRKANQLGSEMGKKMRDEAAKPMNAAETSSRTSYEVGDEMFHTEVVLPDEDLYLDMDVIGMNEHPQTPPSEQVPANQPSGSQISLPATSTQSTSPPSLLSLETSPRQMNNVRAASSTPRNFKRKRGVNVVVESYMSKKQDLEDKMRRREIELEEKKIEVEMKRVEVEKKRVDEEAVSRRRQLDLEERKHELQLKMFEFLIRKDEQHFNIIKSYWRSREQKMTKF